MARPQKYPWHEWADGNVHEINLNAMMTDVPKPSQGYELEKLLTAMRVYASRKGKRLHTERVMRRPDLPPTERPVYLVFQIIDQGEAPAPAFDAIRSNSRVALALDACDVCGRGGA